jgi:hypothetical protein
MPLVVSHGNDRENSVLVAIDQGVRIPPREDVPTGSSCADRPALGRLGHRFNCVGQLEQKPSCCERTAFCVPVSSFAGILYRLGVPARFTRSH